MALLSLPLHGIRSPSIVTNYFGFVSFRNAVENRKFAFIKHIHDEAKLTTNKLKKGYYYMASNSQAKWSNLIGWFSVGILQYGPLPWKRTVSVFLFSPPGSAR